MDPGLVFCRSCRCPRLKLKHDKGCGKGLGKDAAAREQTNLAINRGPDHLEQAGRQRSQRLQRPQRPQKASNATVADPPDELMRQTLDAHEFSMSGVGSDGGAAATAAEAVKAAARAAKKTKKKAEKAARAAARAAQDEAGDAEVLRLANEIAAFRTRQAAATAAAEAEALARLQLLHPTEQLDELRSKALEPDAKELVYGCTVEVNWAENPGHWKAGTYRGAFEKFDEAGRAIVWYSGNLWFEHPAADVAWYRGPTRGGKGGHRWLHHTQQEASQRGA